MATETVRKKSSTKIAKYVGEQKQLKLEIKRYFTYPNKDPYESVEWGIRDAIAGDFEQKGVEAPVCWSDSAVGIVAKLYFAIIDGKRENSVKTLITRVVKKITDEGIKHGYFDELDACTFECELAYILVNQYAAFNTPVWINLGVSNRKQSCSACYLLNVEDTMFGEDSITDWWKNEAAIFKSGAGSGVNLSKIRGSMEPISVGGIASGPVSFMRVADANAGTIKSGSVARRAAKLVCLDVDHPDILDFIDCKVREDERMRALMAAGVNLDPSTAEGEKNIAECTSFQNANISVRLSDEFMKVVEDDKDWNLYERNNGNIIFGMGRPAKDVLRKIAEAAWKCADPGVMFDDTINKWHTTPSLGRINTSNPCGETQLNDNTSCNLASLNLVKFLKADNSFNFERFNQVVDIMITAMDITCSFSELPTKKIEENTRNLRQLGLGYSNLGAALMIQGMPYDSDEGRDWAASITSLMTGRAYRRSAELSKNLEPFKYYNDNKSSMKKVINSHINNIPKLDKGLSNIWEEAYRQWDFMDYEGFRNSQVTVIAPTGTISFMMDCDTTGAEPLYSSITYKKLASGGTIKQKSSCYQDGELFFDDRVIQTATGDRPISPQGHLMMLAAIQPHISGAISKTVNLPKSATVDDIYNLYLEAWLNGIKCLAVYRDGSKATQILSTKSDFPEQNLTEFPKVIEDVIYNTQQEWDEDQKAISEHISEAESENSTVGKRRRLNDERKSITHKFSIGDHEGYITAGMYDDGTLGEIFLSGLGKEGSTLKGVLEGWAIAVSMGLQHGIPLESLAKKFSNMTFEPNGLTNNPEIRTTRSILDYIMRWLISKFGDHEQHQEFGVMTGKMKEVKSGNTDDISNFRQFYSGKLCSCGAMMNQTGTCFTCSFCGANSGCG